MANQKVDYTEAVQLFLEGMNVHELAKKYGVHRTTIRDGLRARGIDTAKYTVVANPLYEKPPTRLVYERKREAGVCPYCGKAFDGNYKSCSECRQLHSSRRRAWNAKLRTEGRCICGAIAETSHENDRLCMKCWFGKVAKKCTGTRRDGPMLQRLFEQQGSRCAYTGELLVPGVNASLDHKLPHSRGGTNEPTNLQWVTIRINSMKSDMTHEEFVALCQLIGNQPSSSRREGPEQSGESPSALKREAAGL